MEPRSLPKQVSNQHPNLHRFWSQLDSILGGFGEPSWSQVGTKSLQKSIPKMIKKTITISMASGWIFDSFGLQKGSPRGPPELTFRGLRASWGRLGAKMAPRPLQEGLRDRFSPIFGGFWEDVSSIFGRFLVGFLIDFWLIGWLVGWWVGWLVGWLVDWLVGCLVVWLFACLVVWLCGWLVGGCVDGWVGR